MNGDFTTAAVLVAIGVFLLAYAFVFMDADGDLDFDQSMEYEDYLPLSGSVQGTQGPIEIVTISGVQYVHAIGTGNAKVIMSDSEDQRIRIVKAHADLILMNGQSNAAYYRHDRPLSQAEKDVTPVPEIGTTFYYGYSDGMPTFAGDEIDTCKIYDFVDRSGGVRVGDKGPELCITWHQTTGKKAIYVSLGIPGRAISYWQPPSSLCWDKNKLMMTSVNAALADTGFTIDRTVVFWAQGESDYSHNTGYDHYIQTFKEMHQAAPSAWGRAIDHWYLIEGRTAKMGWVNGAFEDIASTMQDVDVCVRASLIDSFEIDNGLMESDNLHYSQMGDNAVANCAARTALGAQGSSPIYLVEARMTATQGEQATPPSRATAYTTTAGMLSVRVSWDAVDTSAAGVVTVPGSLQSDYDLLPGVAPLLILEVTP